MRHNILGESQCFEWTERTSEILDSSFSLEEFKDSSERA